MTSFIKNNYMSTEMSLEIIIESIFFRRQSDSSLNVGRIIDPRPGLRALSMDPFVPCVTYWTGAPYMNDLLRNAIVNLQTCFSGSENTQELLLRVKTIYHSN
jgi:hypothetical protein